MDLSKLLPPEVQTGMTLSGEDARVLEAKLVSTPDDETAHLRLLGYYANAMLASPEAGALAEPHQLWLIAHVPGSAACGSPFIIPSTAQGQRRAEALWRELLPPHASDPHVLANAGYFLESTHPEQSAQLLRMAEQLDPKGSWKRPDVAAMVQQLAAERLRLESPSPTASTDPQLDRFYKLAELARNALGARELEKARALAQELLDLAPKYPDDWNHGNALHQGHTVLGRVAFLQGDLKRAREHLLASAQTKGSPQLDSFGPSMALAQALLELGENAAVLEYLELCGAFWKMGHALLDAWASDVKAGRQPKFMANLGY